MNRNITAIILIVLAIGIYFTVTDKVIESAQTVQTVNAQYSTAIKNAEQLIKVRDKVLASYNNLSQDDKDRLDKMVPNTVDNIRLIIDLNSVGVRHGFALRNIKATASKSTAGNAPQINRSAPGSSQVVIPTPTLDAVTVSFDVNAPYLEFISFLQDLEANLRIMDVSHLAVTANDAGNYDFNVELKTYWLRQ